MAGRGTDFYFQTEHMLPSKLKPPGPPKNALKMLLASKSGKKQNARSEINTKNYLAEFSRVISLFAFQSDHP